MSGHKITPQGIGALYVAKAPNLSHSSWVVTRNEAAGPAPINVTIHRPWQSRSTGHGTHGRFEYPRRGLRDRLEKALLDAITNRMIGDPQPPANTSSVSFEFVEAEAILIQLKSRRSAVLRIGLHLRILDQSCPPRMGVPFTRHGSSAGALAPTTPKSKHRTTS